MLEFIPPQKEQIGLAHRRLSIIDLSESGHQPMWGCSENVAIVFNLVSQLSG